jgi:hypothetical protein
LAWQPSAFTSATPQSIPEGFNFYLIVLRYIIFNQILLLIAFGSSEKTAK